MKKIYGLAALCAAMTLASCSNEEPANDNQGGNGEVKTTFFAVNLAAPIDTRGVGTAEPSEWAVKNIKFVVFDENKKVIQTIPLTDEQAATISWENKTGNLNSATKDPYVVEVAQEGNKEPYYVMTILNHDPSVTWGKDKTIDDVRKSMLSSGIYTVSENGMDKDYFTMTNSAYNTTISLMGKTNDFTTYTTFLGGVGLHVKLDKDAAAGAPVDIYVERVAARVDIQKGTAQGDTEAFPTEFAGATGLDDEGNTVTFNVSLDGVGFIYDPTEVNLVKNIDGVTVANSFDGWMDAGNFRSHWGVNYDQLAAADYNKIYYANLDETWKTNSYKTFYINENVNISELTQPTYVAVTGTISIDDVDGSTGTDVYQLWYNGKYYTEESAMKQLAAIVQQSSGYRYIAFDDEDNRIIGWATVDDDDIELARKANTDNFAYVKITTASKELTASDGSKATAVLCKDNTPVQDTSNVLWENNLCKTYKYDGGRTYFYTKIEPEVATDVKKVAVVRNHLYNITFTSIKGLGTPMYDSSWELLPRPHDVNTGDNMWYFGARINILDWKTYNIPVVFE